MSTHLVRLAISRRTYTQSHFDYFVEVVSHVVQHATAGRPPDHAGAAQLRHFTATFEPPTQLAAVR